MGTTVDLARRENAGLHNLEKIGAILNPLALPQVTVSADAMLEIQGWGVDSESKSAAEAVEVVIDGTPYPAEYGRPRGDVSDFYKEPAYGKSGFLFRAPADAFGRGQHKIAVRFVSKGGKSYYESGVASVLIE